jgi:glycosyltransferase XagB
MPLKILAYRVMTKSTYELSSSSVSAPRIGARRLPVRIAQSGSSRVDVVAPELPPELAFLAAEGSSPEQLSSFVGTASKTVASLDQLLSEGSVSEEVYYRALAKHLGCQYYRGEPPLARSFDPVKGLRCGVAPLEWWRPGPRIVIAPRAENVRRLIEAVLSGTIRSGSFAITSPHRFASLVRAHHGADLLNVALGRLPSNLTARKGMTALQVAALGMVAFLVFFIGLTNFDTLEAVSSAAFWLMFSASVTLRSMATVASQPETHPQELADDELPVYTVVVALYREAGVVEDLVKAIDAFDYPKPKLDIKLVVEQQDAETLGRIVELNLPARYEIVVAPSGKPQTKPRALNIALSSARGDLIVVYDAEDIPASDQLRLAAARFAADKDLDCLQGRLAIRNHDDSWLSKLFAIEYAVLFDVLNPGLCALDLPIALGGTSNHFRIQSLIGVGAWDEWNVTEDADLGIRLSRFGYKVKALDSDTWEEAPHEFGNWFRQRVRWQKGWIQTVIVHSRRPIFLWRDLGPRQALAAITLIFGAVFGCLFWPAFAIGTVWRALTAGQGTLSPMRELSDVFTYILALAGVWTILLPAIIAARFRGLKVTTSVLLLLPVYYILVSAATWVAAFDQLLRPHYWAKTAHGRSRLGPSQPIRRTQLSA